MMCISQPRSVSANRPILPATQPAAKLIELVFDELTLFESVSQQYQYLGVQITGAIAIRPSNPAFSTKALVLLPEASNSPIEITFDRPVQRVTAVVNGARQVRLTGFDRHSNVLTHERTSTRMRQIPAESIESFAWHELEVATEGLCRVVFASDAPFLIERLTWS